MEHDIKLGPVSLKPIKTNSFPFSPLFILAVLVFPLVLRPLDSSRLSALYFQITSQRKYWTAQIWYAAFVLDEFCWIIQTEITIITFVVYWLVSAVSGWPTNQPTRLLRNFPYPPYAHQFAIWMSAGNKRVVRLKKSQYFRLWNVKVQVMNWHLLILILSK